MYFFIELIAWINAYKLSNFVRLIRGFRKFLEFHNNLCVCIASDNKNKCLLYVCQTSLVQVTFSFKNQFQMVYWMQLRPIVLKIRLFWFYQQQLHTNFSCMSYFGMKKKMRRIDINAKQKRLMNFILCQKALRKPVKFHISGKNCQKKKQIYKRL